MSTEQTSLAALSRGGAQPHERRDRPAVPTPHRAWLTRIGLPAAITLCTAALVAFAARDTLFPATTVRAVPVVPKSGLPDAAEGTVTSAAPMQSAGQVIVQAPGWVEPDPFPTSVSALANGVVQEVLVLEGDHVERGQVVARLVREDAQIALLQAEALLETRRAELAAAEAALVEAEQNWENPIELRRRVETTDARLAEKRAELERWPAELRREEARLVYLEAEHQRLQDLHGEGQASDIEMIEARQAHAAQEAEVEATRRREAILEAERDALAAELRAAQEELRLRIHDTRMKAEAQAAMAQARAAVAEAEARRDEAALRLSRMDVTAPVGGIVMRRLVEPGSKVMLQMDDPQSAHIVRLYDPEQLQVRVDIPLTDAAKVGVGQPAEVIVDVLPDKAFDGRVTRVVHEADVQKNTLQVKVAIENPTPELKPEMLARARFFATGRELAAEGARESGGVGESLFVPVDVVQNRSDGEGIVWVADQAQNVARRSSVRLGAARAEGWVQVVEGLRLGDRVIVDPPTGLTDGARIRIEEAE